MKLKLTMLVHSLELAKHLYESLMELPESGTTEILEWGMQKQDIELALFSARKRLADA